MKSLDEAKSDFLQLVSNLQNASDVEKFLRWIKNEASEEILSSSNSQERCDKRRHLAEIASFCKTLAPNFEAICPTENIQAPVNDKEGLNLQNTFHLDAFLYDEVDVEELTNQGKIPTHLCTNCGIGKSHIKEIELMTHSCARDDLEFIFDALLPDLSGNKIVLDIGSRLGAVLFGAYVYSSAFKIVGVEMNTELANMSLAATQRFQMTDRIEIVNSEMSKRVDILQSAHVIILNNVFDWFAPVDIQVNLWQIIRQHVQKGALMVTIPSLEEALEKLPKNGGINLHQWVRKSPPFRPSRLPSSEMEDKLESIHLYQVI